MATSTVPSTRNSDTALQEYLSVREELGELEDRDVECTCDADKFNTCEICEAYAEKNHRAKSLLDLWGNNWAVELGKLTARTTATATAAEFARLLERRDLAAYRVVGAVETVILFWEAQDYGASLALLTRARSEFKRTEIPIAEFRNSHKGELPRHGNRPAA